MSAEATLLPFAQYARVRLDVLPPTDLDAKKPLAGVVSRLDSPYGDRELDLKAVADDWSTIQLNVSFVVPKVEMAKLLLANEQPYEVTRGIVSVRCARTKLRQGYQLDFDGEETWYGSVLVHRDDVVEAVELIPEIIRTAVGADEDGRANFPGAILALGPGVSLLLDEPEKPYIGPLTILFDDFRTSEKYPHLQKHPDDLYFLDPGTTPVLAINRRWASLEPALRSKSHAGAQAALRYACGAGIFQSAWVQLYHAAASTVVRNPETEDFEVPENWKGHLARHLAAKYFPSSDPEDALAQLHEAVRSPTASVPLVSFIGTLAHEHSRAGLYFDRTAKAIASIPQPVATAEDDE